MIRVYFYKAKALTEFDTEPYIYSGVFESCADSAKQLTDDLTADMKRVGFDHPYIEELTLLFEVQP